MRATGSTTKIFTISSAIPHLVELNIGHSIVSRAIFVGMEEAVGEMLHLMNG